MATKINLYRLSLTTDSSTTSDRIDFNDPSLTDEVLKDTTIENAHIQNIDKMDTDGVGDNQGAEQQTGDIQPLGSVDDTYILTGYITKRDGNNNDGQNQFLILLDLWDDEPKNSDNWPEGRFGIDDNGDHTNDLAPVRTGTSQIGLIWESYDKKSNLTKNRVDFVLRFRVSRGDGT